MPLRFPARGGANATVVPVQCVNRNSSRTPTLFLGPGHGIGNILSDAGFARAFDCPVYFVGYRGVDSDVAPPERYVKKLIYEESANVKNSTYEEIARKTEDEVPLRNFVMKERVDDIVAFLDENRLETVNVLGIGYEGSRIGHYLSSRLKERVQRICFVSPSVPAKHKDSIVRLVAVYRNLCRKSPNCPYANVKWLPKDVPKSMLGMFKLGQERLEFGASYQIMESGNPVSGLNILQSITDGSKFGFLAMSGFTGPELMSYKWADFAIHLCYEPKDESLLTLKSIEKLCGYIPKMELEPPGLIESPLLIVSGEFDLPRKNTVLEYYKNNSMIPTLIDQIYLEKASSKFELLRPDVLEAVKSFLNEGNTKFEIQPPNEINWEIKFGFPSLLKYGTIIGILLSLAGTFYVYRKDTDKKPLSKKSGSSLFNKKKD